MAVKTPRSGRTRKAAGARKRRDELILDALERLLATTPLRDLGVEEIAEAAGITRTRFYHYYKSKYEAYAALLHRVAGEILTLYNLPDSWFVRPHETRPREAMARTLERVLGLWREHGVVLREASDLWNAVPEVRENWEQIISELIDATSAAIKRERELGVAPPGPDAEVLANGLIWQGERLLFLALIDAPGALSIDDLIRLGPAFWMRVVYLSDDPDPS